MTDNVRNFSVTVRTNDNIGKDSATVWVTHDIESKVAEFYADGKHRDPVQSMVDVYRSSDAAEVAAGLAYRVIR